MEHETSVIRLRRKLSELSREYSKEKPTQSRSRSANGRAVTTDPNASFRYRRMRRKVKFPYAHTHTHTHKRFACVNLISMIELIFLYRSMCFVHKSTVSCTMVLLQQMMSTIQINR
jgi:hypothetical protein